MSERKIGIIMSYFNISVQVIVAMIYVPMLLSFIGTSEYGIYQLIGSFVAYFGVMDFGLTTAVTRFYTKYKAENDKTNMENILAISSRCFIFITIFLVCIGLVLYKNMDAIFRLSMSIEEIESAKSIFILLLVNVVFSISTMSYKSIINAHEKFLFLKSLESIQLVVQPIFVYIILQKYPCAFSVALVQTILNILLTFARIYYCYNRLHIRIKYHYWNRKLMNAMFKLALSTFAVAIIDQIFFRTNQVILGIVDGTYAVAVYSLAALIYMNYMSLSWAITGVYLPHVTELVALKRPNKDISNLFIRIGRWQFLILALFLSGYFVFGIEFIDFWAGKKFELAYAATLLIIVPLTIDLIQNIGICIMQAKNCYDFRAKVYFVMGILNIILGIPATKMYGVIGAAFITGLMMFIGNGLIMNWFYFRVLSIDILTFWKKILSITWKLIIFSWMYKIFDSFLCGIFEINEHILFLCKIIFFTILYGLIIYFTELTDKEKNVLISTIKCFFSKVI